MKLTQLVHTLNYGDAISGEALSIKRLAQEEGLESQILSLHAHHLVGSETTQYRPGEQLSSDTPELMLLHFSIASPLNDLYLNSSNHFRAVVYHNLTPEHFYDAYNARVVNDLNKAAEDLRKVVQASDLVLADSTFNAQELSAHGAKAVEVLPLLIDSKKWNIAPNPGIAAALRGSGGPNILHVGRTAPNKCLEDIIKAFYFFHYKINNRSKLWLIGSDVDNEIYSFELRRLVAHFRLEESVNFVGAVADSELRAFYENSDLYLAMSEHEGFCVPLIEAMHFGLPVVAFGGSAVPETVGDGGVLIKTKAPAQTAELIQIVLSDERFRNELIARGRARAQSFGLESFLPKLRNVLLNPYRAYYNGARGSDAARLQARSS